MKACDMNNVLLIERNPLTCMPDTTGVDYEFLTDLPKPCLQLQPNEVDKLSALYCEKELLVKAEDWQGLMRYVAVRSECQPGLFVS